MDNVNWIVQVKSVARVFDKEWWVNRTKQFKRVNSQLRLIPKDDGSWEIIVSVGNGYIVVRDEGAEYFNTKEELGLENWGK